MQEATTRERDRWEELRVGDDSVMSASIHPRFEFGFLPTLFAAWDDRTERGGVSGRARAV